MQALVHALAAHPLAALVPMIAAAWLVAGVAWAVARRAHAGPHGVHGGRPWLPCAVVGAAGACVFLAMAIAVSAAGRDVPAFDRLLAAQLAAHAPDASLRALSWLTHLGDRNGLIVLGATVFVALAWRGHVRLALLWALATAGGGSLNTLIKHAFARVRPDALHDYAYADGFSFPSGHAAGAMAVYGMLGYLALRLSPPRWHWPALLAASAIVATVGWSRVALQVHYASDVLAAWGATGTWLAGCVGLGGQCCRPAPRVIP